MKWIVVTIIFFLHGSVLPQSLFSQSLAINTDGSTANSSAILDVKSTAKGILIPRMTKAQKNAITTPATGLLVYQTSPDSTGFQYYDGSRWNWLSFMNAVDTLVWKTAGNAGTDTSRHFIGTKDAMPIRFKQNNQWIGQVNANNQNYFIGRGTGQKLTTGFGNTAFGDSSLTAITNQSEITAFGYRALMRNTNFFNSAFGAYALEKNLNGISNTAIGYQSQYNTKNGQSNLSAGYRSLFNDTLGYLNTALGSFALSQNRTNQYNTAVGYASLFNAGLNIGGPFDGGYNTGVGNYSGYNITTGFSNTVIGISSGYGLLTGFGNTALGAYALNANRRGIGQVAVGYFALSNDTSVSIPNVAIGQGSLFLSVSGNGNTAIGNLSGDDNFSGNLNTFLGVATGNNNFSNTTTVGAYAMADTNNAMILGSINGVNGATADVNVGIGTTQPVHSLHVVNANPNDGGWAQGIMIENTSPLATAGEVAVSFRNATLPADRQWNVGMNQNPALAFNYGTSFAGGNTRMIIDTLGNVGVNTLAPNSKLEVNGSFANPIQVITANTTLDEFDHTVIISSSVGAAALTVSLPAASTCARREYVIVNQNASTKTTGSYRDFTNTTVTTVPANGSITIQSNGTLWYRIR